jgi:16S rRNA (adenine1518-N6/adenine1519-N6)-dimethyltransferase
MARDRPGTAHRRLGKDPLTTRRTRQSHSGRAGKAARRRRLGQHFLVDRRAIHRILEAFAPRPDDQVLEIGAGRGALTGQLLASVGALVAVEIDRRLAAGLRQRFGTRPAFCPIEEDVLRLDLDAVAARFGHGSGAAGRFRVIGNLPYSIATAIVRRFLPRPDLVKDMVVTVQKEVARRLLASPGGSAYGALSVFVHLHATGARLLDLRPGAFAPPPEVSSTVVRLVPRRPPLLTAPERAATVRLAESAFLHRRKMLANALQAAGLDGNRVERALAAVGISGRRRPQELAPEEYVRLAERLGNGEHP